MKRCTVCNAPMPWQHRPSAGIVSNDLRFLFRSRSRTPSVGSSLALLPAPHSNIRRLRAPENSVAIVLALVLGGVIARFDSSLVTDHGGAIAIGSSSGASSGASNNGCPDIAGAQRAARSSFFLALQYHPLHGYPGIKPRSISELVLTDTSFSHDDSTVVMVLASRSTIRIVIRRLRGMKGAEPSGLERPPAQCKSVLPCSSIKAWSRASLARSRGRRRAMSSASDHLEGFFKLSMRESRQQVLSRSEISSFEATLRRMPNTQT